MKKPEVEVAVLISLSDPGRINAQPYCSVVMELVAHPGTVCIQYQTVWPIHVQEQYTNELLSCLS